MNWLVNEVGLPVMLICCIFTMVSLAINGRRTQKRLEAHLLIDVQVVPPPAGDDLLKSESQYAIITIVNRSLLPLTIVKMGFIAPDGRRLHRTKPLSENTRNAFVAAELLLDTTLPRRLETSDIAIYVMPTCQLKEQQDALQQSVSTFIPYGIDSENQIHKGVPMKLDMKSCNRVS